MPRAKKNTRNLTGFHYEVKPYDNKHFTLTIAGDTPKRGPSLTVHVKIDYEHLPYFVPRISEEWKKVRARRVAALMPIDAALPAST